MKLTRTRIGLILVLTALIGLAIGRLGVAANQAPAARADSVPVVAAAPAEIAPVSDVAAPATGTSTRLDGVQTMTRMPGRPDTLVAGVETAEPVRNSVYASLDGGRNWQLLSDALPSRITVLVVPAGDLKTLYAGTEATGVLKSVDGGKTWLPSSHGLGAMPNVTVTSLAVDDQNPNVLRATIGYYIGTSEAHFAPAGTWLSTDGGSTWAQESEAGQ